MADNGNPQFRYQSMKVVRGRETGAITRMQKDGWELDSQTQGRLRTELHFRRARKPVPTRLIVAAVVAAVVAIAVVGGIVVIQGAEDEPNAASPTSSTSETLESDATPPSEEPSEATSAPPEPPAAPSETTTESEEPAPDLEEILTVDNNPDLRRLLRSGDDSALSRAFATTYAGRTIEFDGNVASSGLHGGYDTRFDFLIYAGDYSETTVNGPSFQFRDVNFYDLNLKGRGSSVGMQDNLHIVAEVGAFEARTGLFLLVPVSTRLR